LSITQIEVFANERGKIYQGKSINEDQPKSDAQ
jgi:hypothetical protein